MNGFTRYHTTDRKLATLAYIAGQPVKASLSLRHRYSSVCGVLNVVMKGGAIDPVGGAQEGILALINNLYVTVNGTSNQKHAVTGKQIFVRSIETTRKVPAGFESLGNADKTYEVIFDWMLSPANIAPSQARDFGLDLLKEASGQASLDLAEVVWQCGTNADLYATAGDMGVQSASLELYGVEEMLPVLANGQAYNRANEFINRTIVREFPDALGTVEIEAPRVANSFLTGITLVQNFSKSANAFIQLSENITLADDEYKWKDAPIKVLNKRQNAVLDDVPANIIFIPLMEQNDLRTALPDASFSDQLMLRVPVNPLAAGGPDQKLSLTAIFHFAKEPSLS